MFAVLNLFAFHLLGSEHPERGLCLRTSPHSSALEVGSIITEKLPSFRRGPLFFAVLLTTVNNLSLFLPLLFLSIYRCFSSFFPSKCAYSIPSIPADFKMHDFETSRKEREKRGPSLWSFAYPQFINVSSIMRKAKLDQAFSALNGHIYPPSLHIDELIDF